MGYFGEKIKILKSRLGEEYNVEGMYCTFIEYEKVTLFVLCYNRVRYHNR